MSQVFISYSRRDQDIAGKIADRLTQAGISIWTDTQLQAGIDWSKSITNALHDADCLILVLSNTSVNSTSIVSEYTYFMSQNKRIYVVKVDDVPFDEIPPRLYSLPYIDLTTDFDRGIQSLVDVIKHGKTLSGNTLQDDLSDVESAVTLEVDLQHTDADKVVDVIRGLLDKGVRSIKVKNG